MERFSSYSGYGKTFQFAGDYKDESQVSKPVPFMINNYNYKIYYYLIITIIGAFGEFVKGPVLTGIFCFSNLNRFIIIS